VVRWCAAPISSLLFILARTEFRDLAQLCHNYYVEVDSSKETFVPR